MPLSIETKGLAKPLTKLIESVSKGIGAVFEPTRIVRKAKAEKQAALILAQGKVEEEKLLVRAARRMAFVEKRRQHNIESIIREAQRSLPESVSSKPVSEDWVAQFFESSKDVSDGDMQKLWARVLAGEVAIPGAFSRRTLDFLKTCDQRDARAFTAYCGVAFSDSANSHFAFQLQPTYNALEAEFPAFNVENHLVSLGLLVARDETVIGGGNSKLTIDYFGKSCKFSPPMFPFPTEHNSTLHVKRFTALGEELVRVVAARPVPHLIENIAESLSQVQAHLEQLPPTSNGATQRPV